MLVALGKSTEQIGRELYIAPASVKAYISKLYSKLGLQSTRVDITLYAVKYGIIKREEINLNRDEMEF